MPPQMNKADFIITYTSSALLFFKEFTKQKSRRMQSTAKLLMVTYLTDGIMNSLKCVLFTCPHFQNFRQ